MSGGTTGDGLWAFVVIGGFLILAAAIAWAKMKNKVTDRENNRTEDATRRLYEEQSAEDNTRTP